MGRVLKLIFWRVNCLLVKLTISKKFNLQVTDDSDNMPDGPFILVANHANFFDPWLVGHFSSLPVSIMMNEEGFKASAITRWYLKTIGAFPKKKGSSDLSAMKVALKRLSQGSPLLIFPEGQTSWDGATQPIYGGMEKLIRRSKVPLVICRLEGHFLSKPWWSSGKPRGGSIALNRKVLSPEQISSLSLDELRDTIITHISHNECKSERNLSVNFTGTSLTDGIERLLWLCPHCESTDMLNFAGDTVTCLSCRKSFTFTPHMKLQEVVNGVEDLYDWVSLSRDYVKKRLSEADSTFAEDGNVSQVRVDYGGRVIMLDTGKLTLTTSHLIFEGEDGTQRFAVDKITSPVFQFKDILEIEYESSYYQFLIKGTALYKWLTYLRYQTGYAEAEERGYM